MNMNKNFIFCVIIIFSFCLFNKNVNADSNFCSNYITEKECNKLGVCRWKNNTCISTDSCRNYTNEDKCLRDGVCKWDSGICVATYVAENPCDENAIRKVLKIFGYILLIAKVAIPLIIIGYGTIDLFKSVVDKDEKSLGKQLKQLGVRIIAGFIVFFIPNIINALFGLSDAINIIDTDQYKTCTSCLLEPTNDSKCSVID